MLQQIGHAGRSGSTCGGAGRTASPVGARRTPRIPADPAYDWATYDRTVRYAVAYEMTPIFTVIGTPVVGERVGRLERGTDERRPTCRRSSTAAARRYSGTYRLPDGTPTGRVSEVDRLERAEQPGLPEAPVRPRPAASG